MGSFKYEAWGAYAWNAHKNCYDIIWLSNLGEGGLAECRRSGKNKLILTSSRQTMGQPMVERTIVDLADDGTVTGIVTTSITADHDPVVSFKASYKKQ